MTISIQLGNDGSSTVRIDGRFDFQAHKEFRSVLDRILPGNKVAVVMSGTEYMDSSALGMLLLLREKAGGDGAIVEITGGNDAIRNILRIANFHKLFRIA